MKTTEDTIVNMAKDYLELDKNEREKSLFISSTNHEKEEVTNLVRAELKSKGDLKESFSMTTYAALDYNEHALKYSRVYNVGDVVILNKKAQGLESNRPYILTELNEKKNTITVKTDKGTKEIQVAKVNCSLFREEAIEICEGDKMKWTKNHFSTSPSKSNDGKFKDEIEKIKSQIEKNELEARKKERRLNGECFTVKKLDKDLNVAVIEYENGKQESVNLKQKQFIDYSYVSTVHSSQGKTCNKVYASLSRVDKENFYVAVSRAKFDCKLYVTNKEHLYENVLKSGANKTAKEKISTLQKQPLDDEFGLLTEEVAQKITDIQNKDMKKLIGNEMALARLNRKIKESSFEVIYKLNLEPEHNDLEKLYKIGKTNQEIVAKLLHKEVNTSFGVDGFLNRSTLPAKHLFEAYKKSPVFVEQTLRKLDSALNPTTIQQEVVQKKQPEQQKPKLQEQKPQTQVESPRRSQRMRPKMR